MTRRGRREGRRGTALILVLLVLTALVLVGAPFLISMILQDRASQIFGARTRARLAAEAGRDHAIALLLETSYPLEWEEEAARMEEERLRGPVFSEGWRQGSSAEVEKSAHSALGPRRGSGTVRRADRGEERPRRDAGGRTGRGAARQGEGPAFAASAAGPSDRDEDGPEELKTPPPAAFTVARPEPPPGTGRSTAEEPPLEFRFQDPRGTFTGVHVEDEQGKVDVNTAPPNLLAGLLGAAVLAEPLGPRDTRVVLDDASRFPTDSDPRTIDGAVVVGGGMGEVLTYRRKTGNVLEDCFRGAYFSLVTQETIAAGVMVYDLRGWKLGHHRLWSPSEGGFHARTPTRIDSVEGIRAIASWQVASLFITRLRGEGFTQEFLESQGIQPRRFKDMGLDPYLFTDEAPGQEAELEKALEQARGELRRLGFRGGLVTTLEKRRGARVLVELAARLRRSSREEAQRTEAELEASLKEDQRSVPRLDPRYTKACLEHLAECYQTAGLETFEPGDVEALRGWITAHALVPARWSEARAVTEEAQPGKDSLRLARETVGDVGPGSLVRLRSMTSPGLVELNAAAFADPAGGVTLQFKPSFVVRAHETWIDALIRAPVNVNTAPFEVLRAIFTGVGFGGAVAQKGDQEKKTRGRAAPFVTPGQAEGLARLVLEERPLKGPKAFHELLKGAAERDVIEDDDVLPLLANSLDPCFWMLKASTTSFVYGTSDLYSIESRALIRAPAGAELAEFACREVVQVSPPYPVSIGLITQADFSDGVFIHDPTLALGAFPRNRLQSLLKPPGVYSRGVISRPLILHRAPLSFPGGDRSDLRLFPAETPDAPSRLVAGEVLHYPDTYEGLELAHGEPLSVPLTPQGAGGAPAGAGGAGGAGGAAGPGAAGMGGQSSDLTTIPGGIEFWTRMRTFPSAVDESGHPILFDAGTGIDRNRITLVYAPQREELLLRVFDASVPDPSIERTAQNGQFLQVTARRPLELETWYHFRILWNGTFGGGAQLFVDGFPVGEDNLSTELVGGIPAEGSVGAISVKDAALLPREGVVRIDQELFEYTRSGNALQVRREPPSVWTPLLQARSRGVRFSRPPLPGPGGGGGGEGPGRNRGESSDASGLEAGLGLEVPDLPMASSLPPGDGVLAQAAPPAAAPASSDVMRAPWNRRGSTPSAHLPGARVALHGYALEVRRKIRVPNQNVELQVPDGDGAQIVVGPGGLRNAELLPAFSFPPDTAGILHYDAPLTDRGDPLTDYLVPLFDMSPGTAAPGGPAGQGPPGGGGVPGGLRPPAGLPPAGGQGGQAAAAPADNVAAQHPAYPRNAIDYFQSQGVVTLDPPGGGIPGAGGAGGGQPFRSGSFLYIKEALPAPIIAAQSRDPDVRTPQTLGLRIVADYPPAPGQDPLANWRRFRQGMDQVHRSLQAAMGQDVAIKVPALTQRSLRASGPITGRYPVTGILEVRGTPAPWDARPSYAGQPIFAPPAKAPDDVVEWVRYAEIFDQTFAGVAFRLFVGRTGSNFNFRGYPERYDPGSATDLRKQLDLPFGEPIRLVLELAAGGAGYGDYVTLATRDPQVHEPMVKRVFRTLEHEDGRFFVSVLDVGRGGLDAPGAPSGFSRVYTRAMEPRLVKFPSGGLPEVGTGNGVLFGNASAGLASPGGAAGAGARARGNQRGRSQVGGVRSDEDEDATGITVDEVRRFQDPGYLQALGPNAALRHVLVPLDGGRVRLSQGGPGRSSIGGMIPRDLDISPSRPLEVLVVTLSQERGRPSLFARDEKEGLLRIGSEVFYFIDPLAGAGGNAASAQAGSGTLAGPGAPQGGVQPPNVPNPLADSRLRDPLLRSTVQPSIPVRSLQGRFEPEGFARIQDLDPERQSFFEVFYYQRLGGGFQNCLRGQFQTIVALNTSAGNVHNVTRRLQLAARSLLGSERAAHGVGDPVALVPVPGSSLLLGAVGDVEVPVKDTRQFGKAGGHLLIDPGQPGLPWEILAYDQPQGESLLLRPRDERGHGVFRGSFGTAPQAASPGMVVFDMTHRYADRYAPQVESEAFSCLQRSYTVPGALWRAIEWTERPSRALKQRRSRVVVAVRFDGEPDWSLEPGGDGGLLVLEDTDDREGEPIRLELGRAADQVEVRVYFRFPSGCFTRIRPGVFTDDWKETPILEALRIEYEAPGGVLRHEELPF